MQEKNRGQKSVFKRWVQVIHYIYGTMSSGYLSFMAGGVAFYSLLSIFPALFALVSLYGLVTQAQDLQIILTSVERFLPADAFDILRSQLSSMIDQSSPTLSFAFISSLVLALFSASRGVMAMMATLNNLYGVKEERPVWKYASVAYFFTFCGLLVMAISVAALVFVPIAINFFNLPDILKIRIIYARWVILGAAFITIITMLFWLGPNRPIESLKHTIIGAATSALLWMIMSLGLSLFIQAFPAFNAVYGSLSAVIVLMLWFLASVYAILLGAAVHAGLANNWRLSKFPGDAEDA